MQNCPNCKKVLSDLEKHEKRLDRNDSSHIALWESVKNKISTRWLIAIIPLIVVWIGGQMAIYNSIKEVQKDVAVINTVLKINHQKGP